MTKQQLKPKTHTVPCLWPGETVAILASGPSLTAEQVESVRGRARVIVINGTYALAPWADAMYAADARVFKWFWHQGPKPLQHVALKDFAGLKFSVSSQSGNYAGVKVIGRGAHEGLSLDPGKLCLGSNSGYQAINLAALLGGTRILLLGYDMGVKQGQKQHWHGDYPMAQRSPYSVFRKRFQSLVKPLQAAGIEVLNCTPGSALECFPMCTLAEALQSAQVVAA